MWTGLFTLQYKDFLTNLQGKIPAADLARINPDALKWTSNQFNASNGPYVIPLENQFYIGFYNKAAFAKAGVTSVPADWTQLFAACKKLKAAGYMPLTYGNGGQPLGPSSTVVRHELHMMIGAHPVRAGSSCTAATSVDLGRQPGPAGQLGQAQEQRVHQRDVLTRPTTWATSRPGRPR